LVLNQPNFYNHEVIEKMVKFKSEKYNGFKVDFRRDVWGWVVARAESFRNKNTRRQEYAIVVTDGKTKKEAFDDIKKEINKKRYIWKSSGLQNATYLKK
jgi:hypothetical protein